MLNEWIFHEPIRSFLLRLRRCVVSSPGTGKKSGGGARKTTRSDRIVLEALTAKLFSPFNFLAFNNEFSSTEMHVI